MCRGWQLCYSGVMFFANMFHMCVVMLLHICERQVFLQWRRGAFNMLLIFLYVKRITFFNCSASVSGSFKFRGDVKQGALNSFNR
ncbi:hypothetical protein T492DRAFT_1020261 [Pavlovales sp. CCMP2436]|nr:hypothetical protein T492DRAFT_1020261 [Pavlovales sp. CCMP2436]